MAPNQLWQQPLFPEHIDDAVGAFGRLTISGREADVDEAAAAAVAAAQNPAYS